MKKFVSVLHWTLLLVLVGTSQRINTEVSLHQDITPADLPTGQPKCLESDINSQGNMYWK